MKRGTILSCWILMICFLFPLCGVASDKPKPDGEMVRINRLVSLCKLWGRVKYFHPSLAYRTDIDWDAALLATIPKVLNAKTPDQYADALQSLLDVLDDSLTRIVKSAPQAATQGKSENRQFDYRLTGDGVLVISVGNYSELTNLSSQKKLKALVAEIPKARAIVFDLRSGEPVADYWKFQLTASFSRIERLICSSVITTPGERMRVHHGFASSSVFSSGQYKSGFFTQDGKRITPAQNAKDIPSVVVINKESGLFASALALQATGKGLIIFEGDFKDSSIGKTDTLDLGDGLVAQIRLSEPIYEDGTSADLQPDATVTAPQGKTDKAMEAALELARNFNPSKGVRRRLAGSAAPVSDRAYSEMKYPQLEYRLLAAFRIWNTFNYFFPYKHLMERDWEDVLREFIPKFERAKDALEYSLTVAEMVTHVHDSHAYVSGSVFNQHFGTGYPPIRVRVIENTPVITALTDPAAAKSAGVEVGDVILKVDGEAADARLARYRKYISASTPESKTDKASLMFMNGAEKSVVTLTIRDRDSREKEVKLPRRFEDFTTLYHRERSGDVIKLLAGNIGYVDLDRLTVEKIDEMLEEFRNTKAIIFDMRGYPNAIFFWLLTPRLTDKQRVAAALIETPLIGQNSSAQSSEAFYLTIPPTPPGKWIYKGKTVMLIDERSVSQAEHTGLFFRAANGTKFIGSRTAGANGEITSFSVPGGIGIGFTGQSVKFPDGRQLQRTGIVPDVEVRPTIRGIQRGRDEVLEKAVQYLHQETNK